MDHQAGIAISNGAQLPFTSWAGGRCWLVLVLVLLCISSSLSYVHTPVSIWKAACRSYLPRWLLVAATACSASTQTDQANDSPPFVTLSVYLLTVALSPVLLTPTIVRRVMQI